MLAWVRGGGLLALAAILGAVSIGVDFANALLSRISDLFFVGAAGILVYAAYCNRSRGLKARILELEAENQKLRGQIEYLKPAGGAGFSRITRRVG